MLHKIKERHTRFLIPVLSMRFFENISVRPAATFVGDSSPRLECAAASGDFGGLMVTRLTFIDGCWGASSPLSGQGTQAEARD